MIRTTLALALSSAIVLVGVPIGRNRAFKSGWFERRSQTRRERSQRRPTHGGLVLALALAGGALLAGPSQPAARATVLAALVAVVTGRHAERAKGSPWLLRSGRWAAAAAVPAMGVRAELTGSSAVDAIVTGLLVLGVTQGVRNIERSDGTLPLVVAIGGFALLMAALRADDPVAPVAAALVGGCLAVVAHAWPPAAVRLGSIGPTALGATLAVAAIELDPSVSAPRSMLVPVLALATLGAAALLPAWDRRLRVRRLPPNLLLPLVAVPGAVVAERLAEDAIGPAAAVAIALVPVGLLALVGLVTAPPRPSDWVSHRRRHLAIGGLAVVVLGAAAAVAGLLLIDARRSMERGREFALAGLDAARAGDLEEAQQLLETADVAFADAAQNLDNPAVRVGELVPGIGPNLRNARTLADVGRDLSSTAVAVAERAGADDLLVVDGRFPVEGARAISGELDHALDTLRTSTDRLDDVESPLLVDEVRDGTTAVRESIADATDSLEVAAEATRLAPALLGADGDRRWMVAILTPSEQRGAGGLAGDFAELRAAGGDIELVRSIPASEMNAATDPVRQVEALPEIYRTRYAGFRVGRFWQNLSATPDVPTFGQAIASAYPLTDGGGPVDGVIAIDPYGIAALLELAGPVTVPSWPVPITADNAARVLLFEHYDQLTEDQIDTFQTDVVEALVDGLTSGTLPPPSELAATLAPAVAGGHLRLWSPERAPQALFERIGADGSLRAPRNGGDFVQLVTQSSSESKIDWFLRRSLSYDATVDPATGALTATATVTLTNTAPTTGVSTYVIGEDSGPTDVGENELIVTVYSPHRPIGVFDEAGEQLPVNIGREKGLYALTVPLELLSGGEATLEFRFQGAVTIPSGRYRLVVGRQPSVVPDEVALQVAGVPGWSVTSENGGRATLAGDTESTFLTTLGRR